MFTGLVEAIGEVKAIGSGGGIRELEIFAPAIAPHVRVGESVCVSGACLTATFCGGEIFGAQIMQETLEKTKLGRLRSGSHVNLERALPLGGRLDGHLVAGHIDEVGVVKKITRLGAVSEYRISCSAGLSAGIAPKGSVAVDGVSLTVIQAGKGDFSIGLIPTTLAETTLGELCEGDAVNLEMDTIARYILNFFHQKPGMKSGLNWDKLAEYGWDRGG